MDLTNMELINEIIDVAKNAYEESKSIKDKNVKNKELNDIVTDVDLFMEQKIVKFINNKFYVNKGTGIFIKGPEV